MTLRVETGRILKEMHDRFHGLAVASRDEQRSAASDAEANYYLGKARAFEAAATEIALLLKQADAA